MRSIAERRRGRGARGLVRSAAAAAVLALAGCLSAPLPTDQYLVTNDPKLIGARVRDKVLWQYRFGLAALRAGRLDEAKARFDDAIATMGGILAHREDARRARSLWYAEEGKTFIGEPYERALAYFYRGILYWMDGEPDNARACFRSMQLMDSVALDAEYRADFVLADYLDGLVNAKLGGDGREELARARQTTARALPDYDPQAQVLVFAEWGRGPLKFADGPYGELLRFAEGATDIHRAELRVGDQTVTLEPWDDIYFQATTRGGRAMDFILGHKAVFKGTADTVGDAALVGALIAADRAAYRGSEGSANTALALAAAGIFSKILSGSTQAAADTRTWDNLPRYLAFTALRVPPGEHAGTLTFFDPAGRPLPERTQRFTLRIPEGPRPDAIVFLSEHSGPPPPPRDLFAPLPPRW